jgi:hypothetical protein
MNKTDIAHASNQYVEKLNIVLKTLRKTPQMTKLTPGASS